MIKSFKALYIILLVAIALTILLLVKQCGTMNKIATERTEKPLIETTATEIPVDPLDPIYGNRGAEITIEEFIDLNSAESRKVHQTLKRYTTLNPQKVRLIWKDFPISTFFSQGAFLTHQAAYCVYKQDIEKFWTYIDELSAAGKNITKENTLSELATKVGVNSSAWQNCLNSTEAKSRVESSVNLAKSLGLKNAPEIYINNMKVNYLTEIDLEDLLNEITKKY